MTIESWERDQVDAHSRDAGANKLGKKVTVSELCLIDLVGRKSTSRRGRIVGRKELISTSLCLRWARLSMRSPKNLLLAAQLVQERGTHSVPRLKAHSNPAELALGQCKGDGGVHDQPEPECGG